MLPADDRGSTIAGETRAKSHRQGVPTMQGLSRTSPALRSTASSEQAVTAAEARETRSPADSCELGGMPPPYPEAPPQDHSPRSAAAVEPRARSRRARVTVARRVPWLRSQQKDLPLLARTAC